MPIRRAGLVVAVVAIGWSAYLQTLLAQFGLILPDWASGAPGTGPGHVVDIFAALGALATALILTLRIEWGARVNLAMVAIKIAAVLSVIVTAIGSAGLTASLAPNTTFLKRYPKSLEAIQAENKAKETCWMTVGGEVCGIREDRFAGR